MARLEFEFVSIGANGIDNDINKINNNFKGLHGTIEQNIQDNLKLANQLKEVRQQLKETGNSNVALSQTQRELQQRYNDSNAVIRQQINAFDKTDGSLAQMRSSLSLANRAFDNLNKTVREGSIGQNLSKQIATLTQEISKAEQATGRFQRNVGNYQQKMSGANGVTMEFNRIIQDAPFGMMGIGNNLQQLASNWGSFTNQMREANAMQGKTTSTAQLLGFALGGIISPINLLTLGVAAVTSGWVLYEKYQQKANKSTEEAKKNVVDLMQVIKEQTSIIGQASAQAQANYASEENKLKSLWKITQDATSSVKARGNALTELKNLYPSIFEKYDLETIKTKNATNAYLDLTKAIQLSAKARSFEAKLAEQFGKQFDLQQFIKENKDKFSNMNRLIAEQKQFAGGKGITLASAISNLFGNQENQLVDYNKNFAEFQKILTELGKTDDEIKALTGELDKLYQTQANGLGFVDFKKGVDKTTKSLKDQRDYLLEIQQILQNSQSRVDTSGEILNWDKELIKVHDYYDSQNLALDKMLVNSQRAYAKYSAKRQQIEQAINSTRITLHNNMINELSKIDDKYFSEGMAKVAELNAKYSDSMDLDTRSNALKKVRDEFAKLREEFKNDPIISQEMLDKWQENQTLKVNWEFDNKDLEEWGKLNDRIQETIDKPFNGKNTRSIQSELEKRIDIIKRLLEQLSRATGQPFDQAEFDRLSTELKNKSTDKYNTEQAKKDIQDYVTIANNGLNSVFTNLKSNIDEFGLKARSVFYTLGESLGDLIKQLANKNTAKFMEQLTKDAKNFSDLKDNWKNMSSQDKWSAGLGFAGGAVSSLTPQTSSGGQALGGALSGAAAGMTFGPWGAAIGAVVGGVSGLLKAAKNKRQEKILLEQYEEQKKANRLLERMSALSYASQIIGQKTEYGIVSGVRRNEFGQIVSVVQGQDIIMVADRANQQKGR